MVGRVSVGADRIGRRNRSSDRLLDLRRCHPEAARQVVQITTGEIAQGRQGGAQHGE